MEVGADGIVSNGMVVSPRTMRTVKLKTGGTNLVSNETVVTSSITVYEFTYRSGARYHAYSNCFCGAGLFSGVPACSRFNVTPTG